MEDKKNVIIVIIIICICFIFVGYFNYEKIVGFFAAKEWEFAESFASIRIENATQVEAGKKLLVFANNRFDLYGGSVKSEYSENKIVTGFTTNSCGDYFAVVSKDTNEIYLFKESELLWKNSFNWKIINISVNKNGYVTVIYSQSGYKSSIKIFKPNGTELFTTYLASTYAVDVEISNDNKTLYIAEMDTEGIKIKSNIKIIDIAKIEAGVGVNPDVEIVPLGVDDLVVDIEFEDSNKLFIQGDSKICYMTPDKNITKICDFDTKNTLFVSIDNINVPVVVEKVSTGIFTNETNLKIYSKDEILEIKLDRTPQSLDTLNTTIALNLGDEVLFLNEHGKVKKRFELENQLSAVKLYDRGNLAALVFRDRIELVKL